MKNVRMKYFYTSNESDKKKVDKWLKANPDIEIEHIEIERNVNLPHYMGMVTGMWFIYKLEK